MRTRLILAVLVIGAACAALVPGPRPAANPFTGVAAVDAGLYHTCALDTSGGLKCWGNNFWGQIGDGTVEYRYTPVDVVGLGGSVAATGLGAEHTCAVTAAGGAKCWGKNWDGQLGNGTSSIENVFTTPADVDALARGVPTSDGVAFVPALQGLGTPYADDLARAAFLGLTRGSGRAQLARAVLGGVAHRCVDVGEALGLGEVPLRVDGSLAQSALLLQMIADYGGYEVLRAAEVESTAIGAVFLAGLATGVFSDPERCRELLEEPVCFTPRIGADARASARADWVAAVARTRSTA